MKDTKRQVFENQGEPLTKKLGEVLVPNPIRWTHDEKETTLEGKSGYGKIRFAELPWATATSKPFGSVFKPKRPEPVFEKHVTQKVRNLRALREASEKFKTVTGPAPQHITCADCEPVNMQAIMMERAQKCVSAAALMADKFAEKRIKTVEPERVKVKKRKPFKPGITGLDKVRRAKPDPMPDWQKEKEERGLLVQYWLLLRSIYDRLYS